VSHAGLRSLATGNPFGMSLLSQLAAVEGAGTLFKMLGNVLSAGQKLSEDDRESWAGAYTRRHFRH
jgi:hypothetical protein